MSSSGSRRVLLWTYDAQAASTRHRLLPVVAALAEGGWQVQVEPFPKKRYYQRVLERRQSLSDASVLLVGKISFGVGEAELLRAIAPRIIFDLDDAIYLRHSEAGRQRGGAVRQFKFTRTCAAANHIVAGNDTLAAATGKPASEITVLPTSVEIPEDEQLAAWRRHDHPANGKVVVWIGRPENLIYLEPLRPVFAELSRRRGTVLRVVCSHFPDWPEVTIERVGWSPENELPALAGADVGIMPLRNDAWSRGKCGFKLLQYMSVALPTVASPVGLNEQIVEEAVTGHFATEPAAWSEAIEHLLDQPDVAMAMGHRGRQRAIESYDREDYIARYVETIERLAAG